MNNIEIGKYIRRKRIERHLTQKELAEKLAISFQAVSKWETGVTLPDTSILLELGDILEVTVDQILNAGEFRRKMNKRIDVEKVYGAIKAIVKIKKVLGPNNGIYKSMLNGLNEGRDTDFEQDILDEEKREIMVAKSVLQLIVDGFNLDRDDIDKYFKMEKVKAKLTKYVNQYQEV